MSDVTDVSGEELVYSDDHQESDNPRADLPELLPLRLAVKDPESISQLRQYPSGTPREEFALRALRIGILALRQAQGQLDADLIQRESQRMLSTLGGRLDQHAQMVHERLTGTLKDYFDPQSGRFQQRVERLIKQDGELETLLRQKIGADDSELARTLTAHVGQNSPLLKQLDPEESQGLLAALRGSVEKQLTTQRELVLNEFSLDNKQGALARFIGELTLQQGKLSEKLQTKLDDVVKQFSLDEEDSALNRMVNNVDRAQRVITSEFSLDNAESGLSRLKAVLDSTNAAIHSQLTLDDEQSALARLKRELLTLLEKHSKQNLEFQEEIKVEVGKMAARRSEADLSTRHGIEFETVVCDYLETEAQKKGDVAQRTGNTTGAIRHCKVGDGVIEIGPDNIAAGARIVIEAKEDRSFTLAKARLAIEQARKNRLAAVGLFVFSAKTAPEGLDPIARYGSDVVVVWDAEDAGTTPYLAAGLMLTRALCVQGASDAQAQVADFNSIQEAILEIEKRAKNLGDIEKLATTIRGHGDKIIRQVEIARQSLLRQAETLTDNLDDLKRLCGGSDDE